MIRPADTRAIQKAHDLLHAIVLREIPNPFSEATENEIYACHDCLAWVLGFPCGEAFGKNLEFAEQALRKMGIIPVEAPEPLTHAEAKRRGFVR